MSLVLENLEINGFYRALSIAGVPPSNATVTINNCRFAENRDGAIQLTGINTHLRVQSSEFVDNVSPQDNGAAIVVVPLLGVPTRGNVVQVTDSQFVRNRAWFGGGAISLLLDNHLDIRNCSFVENWAEYGGAIKFDGGVTEMARVAVVSSKFVNNTATAGSSGAIDIGDLTYLRLEQTAFVENKATGDAGAIRLASNTFATVLSSEFTRNDAEKGGAISALGARLDIVASNFTENKATTHGGAAHLGSGCEVDLRGITLFAGNNATEGKGGAISLASSLLQTDEGALVFAGNTARLGGAIGADQESSVRMNPGCRTTAFEVNWAGSPQSFVYAWAVVRRVGGTNIETSPSGSLDERGTWMSLAPTPQADTSVSFCLSPGKYEVVGTEGVSCYNGWEGGLIRVVDSVGTELATLTLTAEDGCSKRAFFTIAADATLTDSSGPVQFEKNVATGSSAEVCGTGCGGAFYVGTVRSI